jgi:hypothetical protein
MILALVAICATQSQVPLKLEKPWSFSWGSHSTDMTTKFYEKLSKPRRYVVLEKGQGLDESSVARLENLRKKALPRKYNFELIRDLAEKARDKPTRQNIYMVARSLEVLANPTGCDMRSYAAATGDTVLWASVHLLLVGALSSEIAVHEANLLLRAECAVAANSKVCNNLYTQLDKFKKVEYESDLAYHIFKLDGFISDATNASDFKKLVASFEYILNKKKGPLQDYYRLRINIAKAIDAKDLSDYKIALREEMQFMKDLYQKAQNPIDRFGYSQGQMIVNELIKREDFFFKKRMSKSK